MIANHPVRPSRSEFVDLRGLRTHVRHWGADGAPLMILLHGWMDASASFQFVVDALQGEWHAIAPDLRGFGASERARDGYWFPDYYADLEALLARYSPDAPAFVVGHSMGGNIAAMYAGIRPTRIARLVNLEGFGLAPTVPDKAPDRYARWLDEIATSPGFRAYPSFDALAARLADDNPRLTAERAAFLARHLAHETVPGRIERLGDPRHRWVNPVLYRVDEALACWRRVQAPVLWVVGADSENLREIEARPGDHAARKAAFARLREVTVDDCGHMMHHDQPEAVARLIEQFAAESH